MLGPHIGIVSLIIVWFSPLPQSISIPAVHIHDQLPDVSGEYFQ